MDHERYVSLEETAEHKRVSKQTCRTEKEFYRFYNAYAREKGFSIRRFKKRYRPGTKDVIWRSYCCSRQGYRMMKWFNRKGRKREPRALTRCGCRAKLEVKWCGNTGLWVVCGLEIEHNHHLAKREHSHVLRSHRRLNDPQKAEVIELGLGGLRTSQIMDVMEKVHGGPEETGFLLQDLYNFFARHKKERIEGMDAASVMNHFKAMKEADLEFFYKYTRDDEGHLKNLFWSDPQSQMDYGAFGDVVIFDSTYRVNRYNLPFVPFIGVNHHRGTVVFGCGIISDETVASYVWLLEAFLEAMHQKHPKSVITDGDHAMAKAIEVVFPNTDHRLCTWHIEQNMIRHLRGDTLRAFRKFIYHDTDVDEFERLWVDFKATHKISEIDPSDIEVNKGRDLWIQRMYDLRHKWSPAYTKGRTFLGMQSNQRSESLNSRLHVYLDRQMSLVDLVEHYEFCLSRIRRNEVELDAVAYGSVPFHEISADPFEKEAAHIFTPNIFFKVREQIIGLTHWEISGMAWDEDDCVMCTLKYVGDGSHRQVRLSCLLDRSLMIDARCSCRMLDSELIPCAHIFTVLRSIGAQSIPQFCVMTRWTMRAKNAFPPDRLVGTHVWSEQMNRFRELRNKGNLALFKASMDVEAADRVMQFFDDVLAEDDNVNETSDGKFFGPLPAHFSGANTAATNDVLNPKKIVTKGAPPTNKRMKRFHEYLRKKQGLN